MLAKVMIDVPSMQTDKPYSYRIPTEFQEMVQVGIRVHVPFGRGNRLIQGIIVGISEVKAESQENLKEAACG